jgi:hypothetical protein
MSRAFHSSGLSAPEPVPRLIETCRTPASATIAVRGRGMVAKAIANPCDVNGREFKLDSVPYHRLCRQVLQRDRWHCQHCGGARDLQVHHTCPRSLLGDDAAENLITFCTKCHRLLHLWTRG